MKTILLFCNLVLALNNLSSAQIPITEKYIVFERKRGVAENTPAHYERKQFMLENGDTMIREYARALYTNEILRVCTYIHDKKEGLEITYYPNGNISSINFYLAGNVWDVVSRADSSGRLICPGTLHNGNGIVPIYSVYGFDSLGYLTYKNGYPEGKFAIKSETYLTQGSLTYKRSAVNYLPAKRVVFTDSNGDTSTNSFTEQEFASLFKDTTHKYDLKLVSFTQDSIIQDPEDFTYLPISYGFSDPAIIPVGAWTVTNIQSDKLFEIVNHDDNGNAIKMTQLKENGEIWWVREFAPCNKRKLTKRDSNGAIVEEYCPLLSN